MDTISINSDAEVVVELSINFIPALDLFIRAHCIHNFTRSSRRSMLGTTACVLVHGRQEGRDLQRGRLHLCTPALIALGSDYFD